MNYMNWLSVVFVLVIASVPLDAQIEVSTEYSGDFSGYKTNENDSLLYLKSANGNEYIIKKGFINKIGELKSEIVTKSGDLYFGHISLVNAAGIHLLDSDSQNKIFSLEEITKYSICDRLYSSGYTSLGLTYKGPGGFNVLIGRQFENYFFFRAEYGASSGNELYGYQFNLGYNIVRLQNMEQNISFGGGVSFERKKHVTKGYNLTIMADTKYIGIFYDINLYGLFIEAGVKLCEGAKNGLMIGFQVGYVYRFL